MGGIVWSLVVLAGLVVAVVGAVVLVDLLPARRGDVSDRALRRAQARDAERQQPRPQIGPSSP